MLARAGRPDRLSHPTIPAEARYLEGAREEGRIGSGIRWCRVWRARAGAVGDEQLLGEQFIPSLKLGTTNRQELLEARSPSNHLRAAAHCDSLS
jgi:hypothetical protein